jgi:hypothetical protein
MRTRPAIAGVFACALCASLSAACGGVMVMDAPGVLVLECSPAEIVVFVDDIAVPVRDVGGERFVSLAPGDRRVMLTAESFLPHRFDVRVNPGERLTLTMELWPVEPELDAPTTD